jgi:DNA helicase HerA-like ATPase
MTTTSLPTPSKTDGSSVHPSRENFDEILSTEMEAAGEAFQDDEAFAGSVGRTMFDTPNSKDNTVTVLLPQNEIGKVPAQSLVRIKSRPKEKGGDGRQYLAAVVQGPFAEPDGLKADAPIVVTTTVRGTMFMPKYHGRIQVEIMGEEIEGGGLTPPRYRPLPNSPVFTLDDAETSARLGIGGEIGLGLAVGFENIEVRIPAQRKSVLPRHLGVLGTTGGGKSTTVSGLINQFRKGGMATVIIDTEGEYTEIVNPTTDVNMLRLLERRGQKPEGVPDVHVYHLINRETTASLPTPIHPFRLDFSSLSPYAAAEILDLNDAQLDRFLKTYEVTKLVLRDLDIFPVKGNKDEERAVLELNEFETGYPKMMLSHLIDIAGFFLSKLAKSEFEPFNTVFKSEEAQRKIKARINSMETASEISWKALLGKLWRLHRPGIFDNPRAPAIPFAELVKAGRTTIIDLSDTQSTYINNLVIANILQGLQTQQEVAYETSEKAGTQPTPLMLIIEEAHEFLSRDKIAKMENLFEQVARIARRGRKRWMGLVFVTQLPQHLPDEVLGLINNFVMHKITDVNVINRLKRSIGGIDEALWDKLPNLAPGQAIVSVTSIARPLLVAIDPTPCQLRMVD